MMKHYVKLALCKALKALLRFDKNVLKKCYGIETPVYKAWWALHCRKMQKELENSAYLKRKELAVSQ